MWGLPQKQNVRIAPFYQLFGHFAFVVNLTYQGLTSGRNTYRKGKRRAIWPTKAWFPRTIWRNLSTVGNWWNQYAWGWTTTKYPSHNICEVDSPLSTTKGIKSRLSTPLLNLSFLYWFKFKTAVFIQIYPIVNDNTYGTKSLLFVPFILLPFYPFILMWIS